MIGKAAAPAAVGGFVDVRVTDYFADAVKWAVAKGVPRDVLCVKTGSEMVYYVQHIRKEIS